MKVIRQLLKEFFLPLLIAGGWTLYSLRTIDATIVSAVTVFGPAFFLISWLVGQFFRVKKQVGVEKSLGDVETRLTTLSTKLGDVEKRLEKLTKNLESNVEDLIGNLNGGDSFCYLYPNENEGKKRFWMLRHCGRFPMYKFHMRLVDVGSLGKLVEESFYHDEILIGSKSLFSSIPKNYTGYQEINVFFQSRNGKYYQEIRFATIDGIELCAYRVSKDYETWLQVLPENFPLSVEDKKDWLNDLGISGTRKEESLEYAMQNRRSICSG